MKKVKKIIIKVIEFDYVDEDILCLTVEDDRGVRYSGSLEMEKLNG